jgi:hypothetical protein
MNRTPGFKFYRQAEGASASTSTAGDAAAASQESTSASASSPALGTQADTATPDFKTSLGDFGKDPALADFKDAQTLAKSFLETKKLVGQKLGIPADDAAPEAKAAFFKALGVPDTEEGYGFTDEGLPEALKASYSAENAKKWEGIMKEHNVPAKTAKALRDAIIKEAAEQAGKIAADTSRSDADFDKIATQIFGDKKEAALQSARTVIEKHIPPELRERMANLPNDALLATAAALSGQAKETTGEDHVLGQNGEASASQTAEQLRTEGRALMASPEFSDPFAKGKEAHEAVKSKVKALYERASQIEAQTKKK